MHLGVRMPVTQRGIQCPTAAVQKITEVKLVKDCCGKLVPKVLARSPQEGEPDFKQCRCAEKKSIQHEEEKTPTASSKPISLAALSNSPSMVPFQTLDILFEKLTFHVVDQTPPTSPPPTPPPKLV